MKERNTPASWFLLLQLGHLIAEDKGMPWYILSRAGDL